jgi:ABC-type nitrate/sulfonate/bicarbonate transport system substrate-binding protein
MSITRIVPVIALITILSACGGAAAPSSGSPAGSAASASSAKPAGSGAASSAASAKPAASGVLQTAYSEIYNGQTPVWVAQDGGIFAQNGIKVDQTYIQSGNAIAAVIAGQIQLAQGGGSEALSAASNGADIMVIGNVVPLYPYIMYVAADIKTINDLKGKKVGVSSNGSSSDIATRVALKKVGLDPDKDVSIIAVGSSTNRTAALQSGAIQGGMDQPPSAYDLEKQGLHALFDMASLKLPTVNNGIVVKKSWLDANRPTAQKYIDSIVQGIARTKKDQTYAAGVLNKYMKLDNMDYATRAVSYGVQNLFPDAPDIKSDAFVDAVGVLSTKNEKVKSFDLNKLIDDSLVQSAVQRGLNK